jgi:quinol-cytochrome oxidoreductase complex cytochrome b subunit
VLALLAALATFYPWELGTKADPFAPAPAGIRPEWYFLWAFQTLKYMPPSVAGINGEFLAVAAISAGAIAALLLPFVAGHTAHSRRIVVGLGLVALAFMTAMTWLALTGSAS